MPSLVLGLYLSNYIVVSAAVSCSEAVLARLVGVLILWQELELSTIPAGAGV